MTKLLHTGDTHLGYRQYHSPARREDFLAAFEGVVADAIEADVDAVVHAGDLFDDRQPALSDVMSALSALQSLADAGVPFYGVVGNHESKRDSQWLDLFERMGVATRLGATPEIVGDVALYGLDFVPRSQRESLDYGFDHPPQAVEHTALVTHGLFEPFDHGDWDTGRLLRASPVSFDALLLGDDHTPRTKRLEEPHEVCLTYCGSTERASASEREDRGYNLVGFDEVVDIRRRGLDTRKFVFLDIELGAGEGTGRVLDRLREHELRDAVVIVTLTGDGERVTPAEIETEAGERGALVARVNDRREREDESGVDVSFANPDRAVEQQIQELGLSTAARELDEAVRAGDVADSNVADTVESRVRELADDADPDLFAPVGEGDDSTEPEEKTSPEPEESDDDGPEPTGDEEAGGPDTSTEAADDPDAADAQIQLGDYS